MVNIPYQDNGIELEGFAAYPSIEKKLPLVILCHSWGGRDDFICKKAAEIAERGYVGFALDMYGKGILGKTKEENAALKRPFIENRYLLQNRVIRGYEVAYNLPNVNPTQVVIIGFGFGAICALELARSGANLKGAVSIYGHFEPPPSSLIKPIKAKILVFHGYNDPVTPQEELIRFAKEMNDSNVDWQAHIYGNTMHAFASPNANDPESGILYNPVSSARAWKSILNFIDELFV